MKVVDAQQARRVLDKLVGYKISPVLWRSKGGLSLEKFNQFLDCQIKGN